MKKKGISPLIAIILAVGFVIILSAVIFNYGFGIVDKVIKDSEKSPSIVDFDVEWIDSNAGCIESEDNYCYALLITNNEDFTVNYIIITISSEGVEVSGPEDYETSVYESKRFNIYYDKKLGEDIEVKVRAVVMED